MHDKPQAAPAHEFRLPGQEILAITGRDATAFAQSQFMNDVATLADGQWQWNGWLTAKGRVVALFALLRLDADTLWLLLPDAGAAAFAEALRRYVFRSKLALAVRDDLHASGGFALPEQARGSAWARIDGAVELDMSGDGSPRRLRIGATPTHEDATALALWDATDLALGLPRLPASQAGQWTPQQLSLERLQAFSVKKGCYPGQEIVARTHFLGQARRGLVLLEADAALAAGTEVSDGARAIGSLIASTGPLALAVLPLEHAGILCTPDGTALRQRPLEAGLAR